MTSDHLNGLDHGDPALAGSASTLTYDRGLRGTGRPWRGLVAILIFVVGYFVISTVFTIVAVVIEVSRNAIQLDQLTSGVFPLTPIILLATNLSLGAMIPVSLLVQRWLFGVPFGSLSSVTGRFRWRWMARLALVIVPVWLLYVLIQHLLSGGGQVRIDGTAIAYIVIVLLTTPLQAAGEEFGARGLLQCSAGSWFAGPRMAFLVSTLISAGLFCLAHGAGDLWLVAYYFVFGVALSIAARGTGGLEAPVLIHATNNVLLFVYAALYDGLSQGIDRRAGVGGPVFLIPMALCLAAALFSVWWARRNRVATVVPRPVGALTPSPGEVLADRRNLEV